MVINAKITTSHVTKLEMKHKKVHLQKNCLIETIRMKNESNNGDVET